MEVHFGNVQLIGNQVAISTDSVGKVLPREDDLRALERLSDLELDVRAHAKPKGSKFADQLHLQRKGLIDQVLLRLRVWAQMDAFWLRRPGSADQVLVHLLGD